MSLDKIPTKQYLNLRDGNIILKTATGEESYNSIEGIIQDIYIKPRQFRGESLKYWYIDIKNQSGELYSLAAPYSSGVIKAILNCLASAEELKVIRIETYQSGEFTKVKVFNSGEPLYWRYSELPPLEDITVGSKIIKDDSKRMSFFEDIAKDIVSKVNIVI
jgi:hypothetical protein